MFSFVQATKKFLNKIRSHRQNFGVIISSCSLNDFRDWVLKAHDNKGTTPHSTLLWKPGSHCIPDWANKEHFQPIFTILLYNSFISPIICSELIFTFWTVHIQTLVGIWKRFHALWCYSLKSCGIWQQWQNLFPMYLRMLFLKWAVRLNGIQDKTLRDKIFTSYVMHMMCFPSINRTMVRSSCNLSHQTQRL